jgi:DNA-binding Xre family transcriptional regulator
LKQLFKKVSKNVGENMAVSYKKLWKLMIDKDINKGKLCEAADISAGTMAKMSKDEPVTLKVIERICTGVILSVDGMARS